VTLGNQHMPSHNHGNTNGGSFIVSQSGGTGTAGLSAGTTVRALSVTANSGGGLPHNNMPPTVAVYYYIRAR